MKVVLFDMDGTLTPPRGVMSQAMLSALIELQKNNFRIGIVSGSDFDYIMQQCAIIQEINQFNYHKVDFFPCNGTKHYTLDLNCNKIINYEKNMIDEIGRPVYNQILFQLFKIQHNFYQSEYASTIPLTGNFIQYRGSMINFCPIGRNASLEGRELFVKLDNKHKIRQNIFESYFKNFNFTNITVKLGGETSFDIYPKGWDKSYVLKNFNISDKIWFVGDKCVGNGNDKEIYDIINRSSRAFQTMSPLDTQSIIQKILKEEKHARQKH